MDKHSIHDPLGLMQKKQGPDQAPADSQFVAINE
jgi:hypothetical protein